MHAEGEGEREDEEAEGDEDGEGGEEGQEATGSAELGFGLTIAKLISQTKIGKVLRGGCRLAPTSACAARKGVVTGTDAALRCMLHFAVACCLLHAASLR